MSTMSIYESTFAQSDKTDAILIVGYVDCTPKVYLYLKLLLKLKIPAKTTPPQR